MKNRRNVLIAFLLCACMIVGLGYAAISETFIVNGEVSYHSEKSDALAGKVHFSGEAITVDRNHEEVESDEITFDLQSGELTATVKAHFLGDGAFVDTAVDDGAKNLVAGIVFEIEIDNTDGIEDLVLQFENVMIEGAVGTQSPFTVTSGIFASADDGVAVEEDGVAGQITVAPGATDNVYLHVRFALPNTYIAEEEIPTTDFVVSVVVNQITE